MLLYDVAAVSRAIAAERSRSGKARLLAACLRECAPAEVPIVVAYLSGELPQRRIGVGPAALRELPGRAASAPSLTVLAVDAALATVDATRGTGSQARRRTLLAALFDAATHGEQEFLADLLVGELRQGALDGVMADAVARAASVPVAEVRRAWMLRGSAGPVAARAMDAGVAGLRRFGLTVGRPVRPMLAVPAPDVAAAMERLARLGAARAGVEWKVDGIRVQVHRAGDQVSVFTRSLDDITVRVPEVVEAVRALPVSDAVFDGEAVALHPQGRPLPFQQTAARTAAREAPAVRARTPLSVFLFDVLHLDGEDLLDLPAAQRWSRLVAVVPARLRVPHLDCPTAPGRPAHPGSAGAPVAPSPAEEFFADAVARGHEGVMVKATDAAYTAGRRGAAWVKVKPRHTLDLVVLAAEWGHGRRTGVLSNLHLGAREPTTGGFVMLGKTFKGLTDRMLAWQTTRLWELAEPGSEHGHGTVWVRPELVVEVAFDGLQRSPRYPAGLALRFARVVRFRQDKPAAEADTVDTVRAMAAVVVAQPDVRDLSERQGETE